MTKLTLPYTDDGRLRLAWISDIHLDSGVAERETKLRQFVTDVNDRQIDAVMITGDIMDDGTAGETLAPSIFAGLNCPYYALLGNHDLVPDDAHKTIDQGAAMLALNKTAWGLADFVRAASLKNVRLIFTDTNYSGANYGWVEAGEIPAAQQAWIAAELAGATQDYALIFSHHPVSDISQWSAYLAHEPDAGLQTAVQTLLDGQALPKVWFNGHDHASPLFRPSTAVPIGAEAGAIGLFGTTPVYSAPNFFTGYRWTLIETKLVGGKVDVFAQPMVVA
jgi:3',5'-cyclic AMP phosphodiesterase CpdA